MLIPFFGNVDVVNHEFIRARETANNTFPIFDQSEEDSSKKASWQMTKNDI